MRAVKLLLLAAFIAATASASDGEIPSKVVPKDPTEAFLSAPHERLAGHFDNLRASLPALFVPEKRVVQEKPVTREFEAKQSFNVWSRCVSNTNFLIARASIVGVCETDAAARNVLYDNFTASSQVAGVCNGACVAAVRLYGLQHKECLAATDYTRYLRLYDTCTNKPQCLGSTVVDTMMYLKNNCSSQFNTVLAFTNSTNSSIAEARTFCSGACYQRYKDILDNHASCAVEYGNPDSGVQLAVIKKMMDSLCSKQANETDVCAVQLKSLGRMECSYVNGVCRNDTNSWCDSNCNPVLTNERMATLCGRCLAEIGDVMALAGLRSVKTAISQMCLRSSSSTYCAVTSPMFFSGTVASTVYPGLYLSNSTLNAVCNGTGASCRSRYLMLEGNDRTTSALESFSSCVSNNLKNGYSEDTSLYYCNTSLQNSLAYAESIKRLARIQCAKNVNGSYCIPLLYNMWWADSCVRSSSCSTNCRTTFNNTVAAAGCCTGYFNDYYASYSTSSLPRRKVVGSARQYNYTTDQVMTSTFNTTVGFAADRSTVFTNRLIGCYANTTEFWETYENTCPAGVLANPPRRELGVALSWAVVSSNPTEKRNLETALQFDIASSANVTVAQINGTLLPATTTQRQTNSTQCKYVFTVNAESQAAADAVVADLDAKVSAGTLSLPATNQAVSTSDYGQGSNSVSIVQGAAPAPTTPAPLGVSPTSPAAAVHIAMAALAALAGLLL